MNMGFMFSLILVILSMVVFLLGMSVGMKLFSSNEKYSPFECGFNTFNNSRLPFSMRFFLICLIFLIFDVELVIMFPFLASPILLNYFNNLLIIIIFVFILLIGLVHEWNYGSLEWMI